MTKEGRLKERLLRNTNAEAKRDINAGVKIKGKCGEGKVMAMWRRPPAMNIQSNRVTAVKCLYTAHRVWKSTQASVLSCKVDNGEMGVWRPINISSTDRPRASRYDRSIIKLSFRMH